jgi:transcriptional regulator with XRE-family HTH domain
MDRQADALRRLGRRLTQLREQQQFTIDELAGRTGLDPGIILKIEAGELDVPLTVLVMLARGLGITASQLVGEI